MVLSSSLPRGDDVTRTTLFCLLAAFAGGPLEPGFGLSGGVRPEAAPFIHFFSVTLCLRGENQTAEGRGARCS
jgi:hypothetical protein